MPNPQTFDEGVRQYAEAVRIAYQQEGDVPKALARVADLRTYIRRLPTNSGIDKDFRLDQIETKALASESTVPETEVDGESHD